MKSKITKSQEEPKDLNRVLRTPPIAQLITELDKLGYELYIKPKPLRSKELKLALDKSLRDSITAEAIAKEKKEKNNK